jgi:uncharacterized membrane protein
VSSTADIGGAIKSILYTLISLVVLIIVALIFFIIIAFVVKWTGSLVFGSDLEVNSALIAAAILSAGVLIGGAGVKYIDIDA